VNVDTLCTKKLRINSCGRNANIYILQNAKSTTTWTEYFEQKR